jgi:positive regulator of sigma E activity
MEAVARVLAVGGGRAQLACQAEAACGACGSGRGCGLRLLGRRRDTVLDVPDRSDIDEPLAAGQLVTITVSDADVLRVAALAYLPTLIGLLAGALLGGSLSGAGDGATGLGGLVGGVAGWSAARWMARGNQPGVGIRRLPG